MVNRNDQTSAQRSVKDGAESLSGREEISSTFDRDFVGRSSAFNSVLETIHTIADRRCPVIVVGETGSGKEMVARTIHAHSQVRQNIFVPVDCTTLTGQLFESQLFGHVKGAFTGAIDNTLGFFRAADGGTIFLDEISEIPLELQAKLLRVLQQESVTPLGSTQSYPIDVRVICATNRNLLSMVHKNEFRADLYYRLNVVTLEVPPLRQRRDDILPLAEYFLTGQSAFYEEPQKILTKKAQDVLLGYEWPGNVRELANAMEHAYVMSKGNQIEAAHLPNEILMAEYIQTTEGPLPTLEQAERKLIEDALEMTGGRKIAAARILGVERRKLNRLIERLNIQVPHSNQ